MPADKKLKELCRLVRAAESTHSLIGVSALFQRNLRNMHAVSCFLLYFSPSKFRPPHHCSPGRDPPAVAPKFLRGFRTIYGPRCGTKSPARLRRKLPPGQAITWCVLSGNLPSASYSHSTCASFPCACRVIHLRDRLPSYRRQSTCAFEACCPPLLKPRGGKLHTFAPHHRSSSGSRRRPKRRSGRTR